MASNVFRPCSWPGRLVASWRVNLSRRHLLALGLSGVLASACRRAPPVMVSEQPFQGQIAPERVPATPAPAPTPRPSALVDDRALQAQLRAFLEEQQGA